MYKIFFIQNKIELSWFLRPALKEENLKEPLLGLGTLLKMSVREHESCYSF